MSEYFYFVSRKLQSSQVLKPSRFFVIVLKRLEGVWGCLMNGPWGIYSCKKLNCKQKYLKNILSLDCDWIWIGLSIQFEKWIWIWILNHIFGLDLDWNDNPKKLD